ncbi:MAG: YfiR family protein [Opitutales bacterium]
MKRAHSHAWWRLSLIWGALLALLCVPGTLWANAENERAVRLRAGFIYNFCKFVTWPKNTLPSKDQPLRIAVDMSASDFEIFESTLEGKTVRGHPIEIVPFTAESLQDKLHIVYLCETPDEQLEGALSALNGKAVLTIGDPERFNQAGGVIQFLTSNSKLRYRINLAAKDDELEFSAKLLQLAIVYEPTSMRWDEPGLMYAAATPDHGFGHRH